MTPPRYPTKQRVDTLIDSLGELSPELELRAQLCRDLAERIDTMRGSRTGAQSMALPGVVRQLEASVSGLLGKVPAVDDFLRYLMEGDTPHEHD